MAIKNEVAKMDSERGVIYIATGEKYVEMAARSAKSLKSHSPNIPTYIFTDCNVDRYSCFDGSANIPSTQPGYLNGAKLDYHDKTPFKKTLFLDADTRVCENITHMFDVLDRFDIAVAYEPGRTRELEKYPGLAPRGFLPVNSGVILYKSTDSVIELMKNWQEAHIKSGNRQAQPTLRDQLWLSDIRLLILPPEYNCRKRFYFNYLKKSKVKPVIAHLVDFKREVDIPPFSSLSLRGKINRIIKFTIIPTIRRRFLGLPY